MILYIKHIDIEGPETIGDFFAAQGFDSLTVGMGENEGDLPDDLSNIDAVIDLGGPMNVYEEDQYPFLKVENEFIKKVIDEDIPYLGLCLGSQLLAKAAGSTVGRSPVEEIGWFPVEITEEGKKDPLLEGINSLNPVFQWHGDMWELPSSGTLLVTADGCPNQAFKVGRCAYGLQFHVEITDESIDTWSRRYKGTGLFDEQREGMITQYKEIKEEFDQTATRLYDNFLKIIQSKTSVAK